MSPEKIFRNSRWFLHAKNELKQEGRTTSIENVMEKLKVTLQKIQKNEELIRLKTKKSSAVFKKFCYR